MVGQSVGLGTETVRSDSAWGKIVYGCAGGVSQGVRRRIDRGDCPPGTCDDKVRLRPFWRGVTIGLSGRKGVARVSGQSSRSGRRLGLLLSYSPHALVPGAQRTTPTPTFTTCCPPPIITPLIGLTSS